MRIEQALKDKRRENLQIIRRHGARNPRIFGSRARGEARVGSDLDILIELDSGRSLLDVVAIKQDLADVDRASEDLLGCKVDVVTEAAISPYIRDHVLR